MSDYRQGELAAGACHPTTNGSFVTTLSNYNFAALNDKEFEVLSCDLVGTLLNRRVERFKPGKDLGVDGRWFATADREGIVQCKHWMRSGFAALLNSLAKKEKPKIEKLKPARYILVTSVELSRQNKTRIVQTLAPYINSESDVLGLEDLEDLLASHPEVEKRHYKLWLSSTSVLTRIFNNAVTGRSDFDANTIQAKLPLLVQTNAFEEAAKLLAARNTVIITGAPGIGKTTLAEQLIFQHLADGYDLVSMHDISEGESVYSASKKQIFYFDDFLGRNILEALHLKHDSKIVNFIRRVYYDKTKRFVLTSRSSILNQGKHLSDLFALEKTDKNEYEIRIEKLSRLDKARILYSHVWHSDLPDSMLGELFAQKRYKTVADHPNFNPRLISFITDSEMTGGLESEKYWGYVTRTLENPKDLWKHFFDQLSQDCRDMAYLVALNGKSISEQLLRDAFRRVRSSSSRDSAKIEHDGMVALKICTGSILNRNIGTRGESATFDLYNPSIADFVLRIAPDWGAFPEFFASLKTIASLRNLQHMRNAKLVSLDTFAIIVEAIVAEMRERPASDAFMVSLCELLLDYSNQADEHHAMVESVLNNLKIDNYEGDEAVLIRVMISALELSLLADPNKTITQLCERFEDWPLGSDELSLLGELVQHAQGEDASTLAAKAKTCVIRCWQATIYDFVTDSELLLEIFNEAQFKEGRQELFDEISSQLASTGMEFERSEIDRVCSALSMERIVDRNIERDQRDNEDDSYRRSGDLKEVDDAVIDDLFERDLPI